MHADSALSASVKRTALSLTQYGLLILRNTKLEVPCSEKAAMLSEFSERWQPGNPPPSLGKEEFLQGAVPS